MTVTAATPAKQVTLRLDFLAPMKATNIAEFTLQPHGTDGGGFGCDVGGHERADQLPLQADEDLLQHGAHGG